MATQPDRIRIVGLILAGGAGQRLGGVRKADLRLGNIPLWRHAAATLAGQAEPLLFSMGPEAVPTPEPFTGLADPLDGVTGPAAGLLAGARWCAAHAPEALMLSVSVDTPFFPGDFAARALPLLTPGTGCVVGWFDGRDYPTNALWRPQKLLAALAPLPRAARGPRLRDIEAALGARPLDYTGLAPANPFAGINMLADLLTLSRRPDAAQ